MTRSLNPARRRSAIADFFYKEWSEAGEDRRKVKIMARDCPRISSEWLDDERKAI